MSNNPTPCDIPGCNDIWCIPCNVCGNGGLWRCVKHAKAHELSDHDPKLVEYQTGLEKKLKATYGRGTCHTCEESKDKVYLMGDAVPKPTLHFHKGRVHDKVSLVGVKVYQVCVVCAYHKHQQVLAYTAQAMSGTTPDELPIVPSPLVEWDSNITNVEFNLN